MFTIAKDGKCSVGRYHEVLRKSRVEMALGIISHVFWSCVYFKSPSHLRKSAAMMCACYSIKRELTITGSAAFNELSNSALGRIDKTATTT